MAFHKKAMDTKITQIAQLVSYLSRPQGHLSGQAETKPRGHVNAISAMGGVRGEPSDGPPGDSFSSYMKKESSLSSMGMVSPAPLVRPYQSPVPYPQG